MTFSAYDIILSGDVLALL